MSRSATPATRNEATKRWKPPKMTTSAELTIGTAIRSSHGRLRTVATVNATPSEHTLNPQTPRVKREPLLRIREKDVRIPEWNYSIGIIKLNKCRTSFFCRQDGTLAIASVKAKDWHLDMCLSLKHIVNAHMKHRITCMIRKGLFEHENSILVLGECIIVFQASAQIPNIETSQILPTTVNSCKFWL